MFEIDLQPTISSTNFEEMRAHYKDYLRYHNYSDSDIDFFISDFDVATDDMKIDLMRSIGVIIKEN